MSLESTVKNSVAIWLIVTTTSGIIFGIGAYRSFLEISKLEVIPIYEIESRKSKIEELKDINLKLNKKLSQKLQYNEVYPIQKIVTKESNNKKFESKNCLQKTKPIMFRTTYTSVNILAKPISDTKVLVSLNRNSIVTLVDQGADSSWSKVKTRNGIIGWVESKRIKLN